ncbi:MAG: response regulator transcription factor [Lewinellaceae bacterium]|nr:response regulator transcription factor [Saprospiraceae bacterium]MCB9340555.1 response regulator transcription factor [Lewinellaceae bacterium]
MTTNMISIGIIENNNILRQNLVQFFNRQQGMCCAHEAAHTTDFFQKTSCDTRLHVVLHEFDGRQASAAKDISFLKKTYPKTEVIIFSKNDDSDSVMKAFYAGATGYLTKNTSLQKIKEAVVDTCQGKSALSPTVARRLVEHFSPKRKTAELTPKETQLVQCLADGLSYKLAADQLGVSVNTILFHVRNLYKKLGVNSKTEVVAMRLRWEC